MITRRQWHVRDKWKRHLALAGRPKIARHIPPTLFLSKRSLKQFLGRYESVFVKPVYGSFGNNIIKISRYHRKFRIHRESRVQIVARRQVPGIVFRHARRKRFMIQKGIALLRINTRPIDYRVLLLRPGGNWNIMGFMGKVATGNRIVTNYNHGGRPINFQRSLRLAGWSQGDISRVQRNMYRLCMTAARSFSSRYKHCRRLGIDLALDTGKNIWILEVNTNPSFDLFKHHHDRSLYRKIAKTMHAIRKFQSKR